MELATILFATIGFFFGLLGFCLSLYVIIDNRAKALSTHRVEMVPMSMSELVAEQNSADIDAFNKARIQQLQDSEFQDII